MPDASSHPMHWCRQFLWSCHQLSLWPEENPFCIEGIKEHVYAEILMNVIFEERMFKGFLHWRGGGIWRRIQESGVFKGIFDSPSLQVIVTNCQSHAWRSIFWPIWGRKMYKPKARRQLLATSPALGILFFWFSGQMDQPVGMRSKRVNRE